MTRIEITKEAIQHVQEMAGIDDPQEAEELLQAAISMSNIRESGTMPKEVETVIEAARAYLEHGFTSDRRKLRDALREYDYKRAVSTETGR
jgi:hypothetical protein